MHAYTFMALLHRIRVVTASASSADPFSTKCDNVLQDARLLHAEVLELLAKTEGMPASADATRLVIQGCIADFYDALGQLAVLMKVADPAGCDPLALAGAATALEPLLDHARRTMVHGSEMRSCAPLAAALAFLSGATLAEATSSMTVDVRGLQQMRHVKCMVVRRAVASVVGCMERSVAIEAHATDAAATRAMSTLAAFRCMAVGGGRGSGGGSSSSSSEPILVPIGRAAKMIARHRVIATIPTDDGRNVRDMPLVALPMLLALAAFRRDYMVVEDGPPIDSLVMDLAASLWPKFGDAVRTAVDVCFLVGPDVYPPSLTAGPHIVRFVMLVLDAEGTGGRSAAFLHRLMTSWLVRALGDGDGDTRSGIAVGVMSLIMYNRPTAGDREHREVDRYVLGGAVGAACGCNMGGTPRTPPSLGLLSGTTAPGGGEATAAASGDGGGGGNGDGNGDDNGGGGGNVMRAMGGSVRSRAVLATSLALWRVRDRSNVLADTAAVGGGVGNLTEGAVAKLHERGWSTPVAAFEALEATSMIDALRAIPETESDGWTKSAILAYATIAAAKSVPPDRRAAVAGKLLRGIPGLMPSARSACSAYLKATAATAATAAAGMAALLAELGVADCHHLGCSGKKSGGTLSVCPGCVAGGTAKPAQYCSGACARSAWEDHHSATCARPG